MTTNYTASNPLPMSGLPTVSGIVQKFVANATNVGNATYTPDGLTAAPIFGLGAQQLQGDEIVAGGTVTLESYIGPLLNSGVVCWVLLECDGGAQQVGAATQSQHAIQLGQADTRYLSATRPFPSGTLLMWAIPSAPSWALVRDGSAISRTTYSALFAVLCPTRNGTTTSGSAVVTALSSTSDLYPGMPMEGAGIPAGATISAITSATSVTLSANATASAAVPITLFYYGYGTSGTSSTFGVPDDRGLFERGLDNGARSYDQNIIPGNITSGSTAVTGLSSTKGLFIGMSVTGSGLSAGTTVASITSATSIVLSANAGVSSSGAFLTFIGTQIGMERIDAIRSHTHGLQAGSNGVWVDAPGLWIVNASGSNVNMNRITATDPSVGAETKPHSRTYLPIIVF